MKKNNQNHNVAYFALNTLAASLLMISHSAYAMQSLDDSALRQVNGQDGISINTSFDEVNVKQLYWEDDAGRGTASATNNKLRAVAEDFKIAQSNSSSLTPGTSYKINGGSHADGKVGLDLSIATNPSLITIDKFKICDTEASQTCSDPIGNMAIQTSSVIDIDFKTRDGLFSKTGQSTLKLGINNANVYLGQTDVNDELNQLILKNLNFNFLGKGVMFIDAVEGFKLQTNADGVSKAGLATAPSSTHGYVDFIRAPDAAASSLIAGSYTDLTNAGLNLEFMLNKNVSKTDPYAINQLTKSPQGAAGLIRVGASGRMVNGYLQLRGISSEGKGNPVYGTSYGHPDGTNILGEAKSGSNVIGNTGIGFRMGADFTIDNDSMLGSDGKATTLEIGGAGLNTYGFEFGNLTGLQQGTRGSFNSGDVYINLADTKSVFLPANYAFQTSRFGDNSTLTTDADYIQNIHTGASTANPYSLLVAVRGAEFQALSKRGRFTNSARTNDAFGQSVPNIAEHNNNQWGLGLPFYGLNANMAMFGTTVDASKVYYYQQGNTQGIAVGTGQTPRLGFSLAMNTYGIDRDPVNNTKLGNKTTSILFIDGATDYYMGLRNIDMLLKGTGSIGVEKGSMNVSLEDMLIVMAAEVAAGYLPGATYQSCITNPILACSNKSFAPNNNFANEDDVLFGLNLRLGGNMNLSLIPNSEYKADGTGNRLNIVGDFQLTGDKNTIQISDPIDKSTVGLDNITGKVAFDNAIVIEPKAGQNGAEGVVSFNTDLTFNPQRTTEGVLRIRDINLYPPETGKGARLGEMAITGGRLSSQFSIMPRN